MDNKSPAKVLETPANDLAVSGKLTLVDKKPRSVLSEGRNYGVGFAFANRKGSVISLVSPISPCKDYLNDNVWSEFTGKAGDNCGLHSEPEGIFMDGCAKIVVGECHYFHGGLYGKYDKEIEYLENNVDKVESFLGYFEKLIFESAKMKRFDATTIISLGKNRHLFIADLFWVKYTYLVSLYSMMIRTAIEGSYGVKGETNPIKFLKTSSTTDASYITQSWPLIERIIGGDIPKQDVGKDNRPHGKGIVWMKNIQPITKP